MAIEDYIEKELAEYEKFYTLGALKEDGKVDTENIENILVLKYDNNVETYCGSGSEVYRRITYTVSTVEIPYKHLVTNYSIPTEFQVTLLQVAYGNANWINKLSDLVINDTWINFTLHDNFISEYKFNYVKIFREKHSSWHLTETTENNHNLSSGITYVKTWLYNKNILYKQTTTKSPENLEDSKKKKTKTRKTYTRYTITMHQTTKQEWTETVSQNEDVKTGEWVDYNPFLRLWKNSTGNADIEYETVIEDGVSKQKPINDKFDKNGQIVKYRIEGLGEVSPATYITNMPDILFENLSKSQATQGYEIIMKYLLYIYTGSSAYKQDEQIDQTIFDIFNGRYFSSVSGIYGSNLKEKVWFALRGLGYSEEAVAGAMGNIDYESEGFSPSAVEKGGSGKGIGLIQWSFGRRDKLEKYATHKGLTWKDEDTQIEFLITEITGKGAAVDFADHRTSGYIKEEGKGKTATYQDWKDAKSIEAATWAFMRYFESPESTSSYSQRKEKADYYYNQFHGKEAPTNTITGDVVESAGYTFPHYLQKNFKGRYGASTIPTAGCGPTSLSMILAGFTRNGNVNPLTLVSNLEKYYNGSYSAYYCSDGTIYSGLCKSEFLQKYYNCKATSIDTEKQALSALMSGKAVIGRETGHVLAFIPVPNEYKSQGYKFYVLDSARGHNGAFKSFADFSTRTGATGVQAKYIIEPCL